MARPPKLMSERGLAKRTGHDVHAIAPALAAAGIEPAKTITKANREERYYNKRLALAALSTSEVGIVKKARDTRDAALADMAEIKARLKDRTLLTSDEYIQCLDARVIEITMNEDGIPARCCDTIASINATATNEAGRRKRLEMELRKIVFDYLEHLRASPLPWEAKPV